MSDITHFQYDVFLSHSQKDKAVARDVAERLKKDGLRVWFDEWEIKPGDNIPAKIEEELDTVVGLLAGTGMIQRLDFGGFILLRHEVISRYAAAVVRKVRKHPEELGCIREDEMLAGSLDYQDFKQLPPEDERTRRWCCKRCTRPSSTAPGACARRVTAR